MIPTGIRGSAENIFRLILVFSLTLGLFLASPVQPAKAASVWTVSTTDDTNRPIAYHTDCSLREAINLSASGDTIVIPDSFAGQTFSLTSTVNIAKNLTIVGPAAGAVISGYHYYSSVSSSTNRIFEIANGATINISNFTFTQGGPTDTNGGGAIRNGGVLNLEKVTFNGNHVQGSIQANGGAIYNTGVLTIRESNFYANNASSAAGGAIYNEGVLSIESSTFSGNTAVEGGAIKSFSGNVTIVSSTINSNISNTFGGGLAGSSGSYLVINSTIAGNRAGQMGGGIYTASPAMALLVNFSTIADNSAMLAAKGGGVYANGPATFTNSILARNLANVYTGPSTTSSCYDATYGGGGNYTDDLSCNPVAFTNTISLNLGTLGNNGGLTQTIPLLPGSSAAGVIATGCLATDQRGAVRTAPCSAGAYEFGSSVDTTAPDTSLTDKPASLSNDATPTFTFTGTDNSTPAASLTFQCSMDSGAWTVCASPYTSPTLSSAAHTFKVRASDATGNVDGSPAEYSWTIDAQAPSISSILRNTPAVATTNADLLVFRVSFSESIQNLDKTDFSVSGTSTASVTAVSANSDTVYDVTVSGGDLADYNGSVGLALSAVQNITDAAGNALSGGNPATNEVYTLVNRTLSVVSILRSNPTAEVTNATSVVFQITFGSDLLAASVSSADFRLTGGANGTPGTVTRISDRVYTVSVTGVSGNGTLILGFTPGNDIQDPAGNLLGAEPAIGTIENYTIDHLAIHVSTGGVLTLPNADKISNGGTYLTGVTGFSVTFTEDAYHPGNASDLHSVTNPNNYLLVQPGANGVFETLQCSSGLGGDDVRIAVDMVSYPAAAAQPNTATAQVNGGTPLMDGVYRFFICGTTSITDLAGNKLGGGVDTVLTFTLSAGAGDDSDSTSSASTAGSLLPSTGFAIGRVTILPVQTSAYQKNAFQLEIPVLHLAMNIVGVPFSADGTWDVSWLGSDAGWLNGSAFPTWAGNSVLTGHVWNADNTPGPFRYLGELKFGDQIIIHGIDADYIYEVRSVDLVEPNDVESMMKHEDRSWITLVTCQGYNPFNGSYRNRLLVRAVLVKIK